MDSSQLCGLEWRSSSNCDGGTCVEVAALDVAVLIRDSAEPDKIPLAISHDVWRDFVSAVRACVFDVPGAS